MEDEFEEKERFRRNILTYIGNDTYEIRWSPDAMDLLGRVQIDKDGTYYWRYEYNYDGLFANNVWRDATKKKITEMEVERILLGASIEETR